MLASLGIVCGMDAFVVTTVVHQHLLTSDLYADALSNQQVYRRIYSEVLTDPDVRGLADDLLGDLDLDRSQQADVIAVSNAVLRLALPPAAIDDLARQLLDQVLAYVRGDVADLKFELHVFGALDRTDEAGAIIARRALTAASTLVLTNLDAYQQAVRSFAAELAAGQIPSSIPVIGGAVVTEDQMIAAIDAVTFNRLPENVRDEVVTAIRSGEHRDALITAGTEALRARLLDVTARLAVGEDFEVDLLNAIGLASPSTRQRVRQGLDDLRAAVRWDPWWIEPIGLAIAATGAVALLVLHRRRLTRGLALIGCALLSGAATTWLLWDSQRRRLESPLGTLAGATAPPSVRRLLLDVNRTITASLDDVIAHDATASAWVGAALIVAAAVVVAMSATWQRTRWLFVGSSIALLAAVSLTIPLTGGDARSLPEVCNGHAELCDRRYDDVAQAASHNAMSSPDVVRVWPEHDSDITAQLDFGIRTLMVDTAYWTEIDAEHELSTPDAPLSPDVTAALFDTLGDRLSAHPGTYACHSTCALGARPLADLLGDVAQFLDENPDEVVTLILQDATSTVDTEAAFRDAGLEDDAFDGDTTEGWPTLRDLIERGQRLVVFSEQHGPPPAWFRSAFATMNDTPHTVRDPGQFTCDLDRGPADASLFLLNHWVQREAPDRADAVVINQRSFIVERARRCAAERGHLPNFVAVDFFSIGDVLGAIDELNGVS